MSQPLHDDIREYTRVASHAEATVYAVPLATLVRWADAAEALAAKLDQAAPWVCPDCGPNVCIDEDGCCATCGADATYVPRPAGAAMSRHVVVEHNPHDALVLVIENGAVLADTSTGNSYVGMNAAEARAAAGSVMRYKVGDEPGADGYPATEVFLLRRWPPPVDWAKEQARADRIERDADWVDRLVVEGS